MPQPSTAIEEQLVEYLIDAHAMEENVLQMLDSLVDTTADPEIKSMIEHHHGETEHQLQRLESCLDRWDSDPSRLKDTASRVGASLKGLADSARSEKAGKNARDAFATEALEIASYELLERWANQAGDEATASIARENRKEEEAMARKISERWDTFIEETIREEGLQGAPASG